jgi:hypothetical protein
MADETNPGDSSTGDSSTSTEQGSGRRRASAAAEGVAAPDVKVLSVGYFTHRDGILGGARERVGVVAEVGDGVLHVIPLEHYRVQVDPAEFEPLTPDDLA